MDFVVRMKASLHMTFTIMDSLPFPRLGPNHPTVAKLAALVLPLITTGSKMVPFWNAIARRHGWVTECHDEQPPGFTDIEERHRTIAEIEAMVAHDLFEARAVVAHTRHIPSRRATGHRAIRRLPYEADGP